MFPEFSGKEFDSFITVAEKMRSDYDFAHTLDAKFLPKGDSKVKGPIVRLLKPFDELFVDLQVWISYIFLSTQAHCVFCEFFYQHNLSL